VLVLREDLIVALGLASLRIGMTPKQVDINYPDRDLIRRAGLAAHFAAQKNMSDAQREFDMLARDYGKIANVQYAYGLFMMTNRDDELAQAAFEREIQNWPKHVLARCQIANIKLRNKEIESGLKYAEDAVKMSPRLPLARYLLGRLLIEAGQNERAIQELETAAQMVPGEPKIFFALARAYTKANRKQDAQRARETFTTEAMMGDRKALQAATAHYLGDEFARTYEVTYTGRDGGEHHPYAASWGATTRLVGAVIMMHGDERGLRLPPAVARYTSSISPNSSRPVRTRRRAESRRTIESPVLVLRLAILSLVALMLAVPTTLIVPAPVRVSALALATTPDLGAPPGPQVGASLQPARTAPARLITERNGKRDMCNHRVAESVVLDSVLEDSLEASAGPTLGEAECLSEHAQLGLDRLPGEAR